MIKLPICETSDLVFPYNQYGNTGRIHSIFSHSFNIVVGERFIHVSGQENFLSSFGIQLKPFDFQQLKGLQINDLVILKEQVITIYSQVNPYILTGDEKLLKNMALSSVDYTSAEIKQVLKIVEGQVDLAKIGLSPSLEFQSIQALMQSAELSVVKIDAIIEFLIGRGLGLTPSGDDILLGYFGGWKMLSDYPMEKAVENGLTRTMQRTTSISREYLLAFLKGGVSSPILQLNQALARRNSSYIDHAIQGIKALGHTSGHDFLFGFLLSLICMDR